MRDGVRSARTKLLRAAEHLRTIKRRIAAYSASKPHKIARKATGQKRINVPKAPPKEIAILAGEMVYQMRSALDHLTFELIKANPNISATNPDWRESCQFPLRTRLPKGKAAPLPKTDFFRNLPGVSDRAFTIIEGMQPYYRGNPGKETSAYLLLLAHLSNIDKHRHLNLICPRVRQSRHIRYAGGQTIGGYQMLDRGAIVEPEPTIYGYKPVNVHRRYTALVAFNEREHLGEASAMPVDVLLERILYQLNLFVVPTLIKLIKNP